MEWMVENKDWIFSGIGVFLISLVMHNYKLGDIAVA